MKNLPPNTFRAIDPTDSFTRDIAGNGPSNTIEMQQCASDRLSHLLIIARDKRNTRTSTATIAIDVENAKKMIESLTFFINTMNHKGSQG